MNHVCVFSSKAFVIKTDLILSHFLCYNSILSNASKLEKLLFALQVLCDGLFHVELPLGVKSKVQPHDWSFQSAL